MVHPECPPTAAESGGKCRASPGRGRKSPCLDTLACRIPRRPRGTRAVSETLPVTKPVVQRLVLTAFALVGCAPGAGCLTGGANSPSEPGSGKTNRSHSEPADRGGSASPAGEVARLALRPEACTVTAGGTQVFIATLYDDAGTPCPDREVEWAVEG